MAEGFIANHFINVMKEIGQVKVPLYVIRREFYMPGKHWLPIIYNLCCEKGWSLHIDSNQQILTVKDE